VVTKTKVAMKVVLELVADSSTLLEKLSVAVVLAVPVPLLLLRF
jgi:hypothetical protein